MNGKFSEKVALFLALLNSGAAALTEGVSISLVREKWLPDIRQLEEDLAGFEKDNADLHDENGKLKQLEQACIQLYVGKITMWAWREAVRSSPEGQRLIALANMYGE